MNGNLARLKAAVADRYRLERELGAGGMATVFLAHDLKHDRAVALKVLRPELAAVLGAERFLAEIRISARLDHPHILTLIDSGQSDGFLWYVLPFVRGESLRERLEREHQLPIPEALAITTQIATALDYAHRQGVIHRDVKPENILLQEGEAVLTDFGIALAVKEAGGPRLTETGLSLGTPQYMSPEQATGERRLDARSDVYSLGAVLYEMLTGEPPHTGATAQVVIAKLMTERPTRVRVLRDTVPEGVDTAIAKALAKVPADRFETAKALARALEAGRSVTPGARAPMGRRRAVGIAAGGAVLLLVAAGVWALRRAPGPARPAVYRARTQVTFTGNANFPALSPDGAQIAYVVADCPSGPCRYSVEVQDLAGGGARRLVDSAAAITELSWSPDRRYLLVLGVLGSKGGSFLVPILGGAPRYLGPVWAGFTPRGDSLLLTRFDGRDAWARIATLDAEPRDSFEVRGLEGSRLGPTRALRDGRRVAVSVMTEDRHEVRIVDRHGVESDRLLVPSHWRVSDEAFWLDFSHRFSRGPLVRVPLDVARGKAGPALDTILDHLGDGFDVSPDGRTIAYVDGAHRYSVWALGLDEVLKGRFAPGNLLFSSTSLMYGVASPNGRMVLVVREEGGRVALSVVPWGGGGPGVDIRSGPAVKEWATWTPDGLVAYAVKEDAALRFVAADPRTGVTVRSLAVRDSETTINDEFAAVADSGWTWVSGSGRRVRVQYPSDRGSRELPLPESSLVAGLQAAPGGRRLAIEVVMAGSLVVLQVALPAGKVSRLASVPFRWGNGDASWLAGGDLLVWVARDPSNNTLYRVRESGHVDTLGTVPRSLAYVQSALDGQHIVVSTDDPLSDIWLARRSRPGQ